MIGREALEKSDKSPVTVADFGSQAVVCQILREAFPHDVIVAEEDSCDLRQPESRATLEKVAGYVRDFLPEVNPEGVCECIDMSTHSVARRYWTLDPIDGTKGFLRNDQYAIALALVEDGDIKVAALACPALPIDFDKPESGTGVLFAAVRGAGATMMPLGGGPAVVIHVANSAATAGMRFVESVESGHGDQALQSAIAQAAGISQPSLRMDSQAKYGAVARGDAALYLRLPSPKSPDYREKIWDHAAGVLIVEEAGGRVSDMTGKELDFASDYKMRDNRGVVVSNGLIHDNVIAALAAAAS
jgi:3'(2'), 5'-bisphosphate nucleotidase